MRFRTLKKQPKNLSKEQPREVVYYASWLARVKAFATDIFMIGLPVALVVMVLFGHDETKSAGAMDVIFKDEKALKNPPNPVASIVQIVLIAGVHVILWRRDGQTPGKRFALVRVVDAKTHQEASVGQLLVRFCGYFLSALPLFLGFFLPLLRKDKRALHDLIAHTAVIYKTK